MDCIHCGAMNDDGATECGICEEAIVTPPPIRRGDRFVIHRGAALPPSCVRCGAAARAEPWRKTYYWHEPVIYVTLAGGLILYAIVAYVVRKRFDLVVPVCEEHYRRPRRLRWIALAAFVGTAVIGIAMMSSKSDSIGPFGCLVAVAGTIAALILLIVADRTLVPKRITDQSAEFAGASPAFLAQLG